MRSKNSARMKKAGSKLGKKEKQFYKKMLLDKKGQIVRKLSETFNESKEVETDDAQDLADKAESSYTKEFLLSLTDTEREQLLQIDEALRAVDKCTYGTCMSCGQPITKKRLEALPWATHCIECQQKLEEESA